jgi:ATP-dependent DNA helicase RecG
MDWNDKLENKFRLDTQQKRALHRLKLFSVADLLFHFPTRYSEISTVMRISDLIPGEVATIYGKISKLQIKKGFKTKMVMASAEIEDLSGKIKVTWFNQVYIAKMLQEGETVKLTGKATNGKRGIYLANPEFEKSIDMPIDVHHTLFEKNTNTSKEIGFSYPIYEETKGITSKWFYHAILKIFKEKYLDNVQDYLPEEILKRYNLPSLKTALIWIHTPKQKKDAESARKRFAFEEVFFIQIERQKEKSNYQKNKSFQIKTDKKEIENFLKRFPFKPTESQKKAINVIIDDFSKNFPMSRLLEGDVGSGKTAVAATVAYTTVKQRPFDRSKNKEQTFGHLQVAYMAPTEILATQHFESFIKYFSPQGSGHRMSMWTSDVQIGLITGSGCRKFPSKTNPNTWTDISRTQLLKWVADGSIPILIGTHALIQKTVKFKNLAFVVIDEQHRFGTAQRKKLVRKDGLAPHLLSMTATPIPRTLSLTIYGDLDLTLLEEMPAGRKHVITEIVTPNKRDGVYEKIREELQAGRQLYVICPRIFEDEEVSRRLELKSVTAEAKRLKKEIFPEYEVAILHSKMSKDKKEEVMQNFSENKINILCATSVVEVGVNVPNATIIIIEGAERFGLAQLHQLRGRVIRSNHQAYCYIFAEAKSEKTIERLNAIKNAKNGFELAELDLSLRGGGELGGNKQWGVSDLAMEAIKNIKMVEAARTEAVAMIIKDPELNLYPILKQKVLEKVREFHFE